MRETRSPRHSLVALACAGITIMVFTSGCCQLFGVCTSASVHTSISSPQQFAQPAGAENSLAVAAESSVQQ